MATTFEILTRHDQLQKLSEVLAASFESQTEPPPFASNTHSLGSHGVAIGAFIDGALVGGAIAYALPLLSGRTEMYLYDIAVLPAHQRKGIGRGLMEALLKEAHARGIQMVFVDAEADDDGAVAFYRSLDAEEMAVRHFVFSIAR